ncbi:hypothetical protein Tco_1110705 [Tanacetum coccineum]|uniref:Uncharacterized protein n=1 Tax=Tanacetum coccineum TaxID=301880 RepID=A0ABQ5IJJ2_9ASTR
MHVVERHRYAKYVSTVSLLRNQGEVKRCEMVLDIKLVEHHTECNWERAYLDNNYHTFLAIDKACDELREEKLTFTRKVWFFSPASSIFLLAKELAVDRGGQQLYMRKSDNGHCFGNGDSSEFRYVPCTRCKLEVIPTMVLVSGDG